MKKTVIGSLFLGTLFLFACKKTGSDPSISLTASATTASVGQTISVTAVTNTTALSWSVTPATAVSKAYSVTTEKTNYFTFSQPGEYTIGVRARNLELDSLHHCDHTDSIGHYFQDSIWNHHVDSLWHEHGDHLGECKKDRDSASVVITVIK